MATNKRDELITQSLEKVAQDETLKQELPANPKAVVKKVLDVDIPNSVDLSVLEESAERRYIVIPFGAKGLDDELTDEMLEMVAGGTACKPRAKNTSKQNAPAERIQL